MVDHGSTGQYFMHPWQEAWPLRTVTDLYSMSSAYHAPCFFVALPNLRVHARPLRTPKLLHVNMHTHMTTTCVVCTQLVEQLNAYIKTFNTAGVSVQSIASVPGRIANYALRSSGRTVAPSSPDHPWHSYAPVEPSQDYLRLLLQSKTQVERQQEVFYTLLRGSPPLIATAVNLPAV
jgi:hypothetical protein